MKKQNCIKCGHKFTYKEKFLSFFPCYKEITCKVCGVNYEHTYFCRLLLSLSMSIPIILSIKHTLSIRLFIAYYILITLISPFFITFNVIKTPDENK